MIGVALFLRYFLALLILSEMSLSKKRLFRNEPRKKPHFSRHNIPRPRVVQGFPDVNNKYPYVVAIEEKYLPDLWPFVRVCTGSLISSQFVITTAHCLTPKLRFVRCGNMTIPTNESSCKSRILKQIPHPSYFNMKGERLLNDIGLLHIEKLETVSYGKLNYVDYKTLYGRSVKYAGYGRTNINLDSIDEFFKHQAAPLYIGEGVIFEDDKLGEVYPLLLVSPKCTKRTQHIYTGDTGGPLFVDDKIVGVACGVEHVSSEGVKSHPSQCSYIPISPYVGWIRQVIIS